MKLRSVHSLALPYPEVEGTRLTTDGAELRLEYGYVDGGGHQVIGMVRFFAVLAHRFEQFRNITVYQDESWVSEVLYAVGEIRDSPWIDRIERLEASTWPFAKRHYVLAFGDVGLFEVVADHFEVLAPVRGRISPLADEQPGRPSEESSGS
jgi:hypothetical protein